MQRTISPIDDSIYDERPNTTPREVEEMLTQAVVAQRGWRWTSLAERASVCSAVVDAIVARREPIAEQITRQMGRPLAQSPGELRGFEERARHMIDIAANSLADIIVEPKLGFQRRIRREPLGVVLTIAAWNYPYLIAVNSIIPAIMAGNSVILKHSSQTPRCSDELLSAFQAAGMPMGLFQTVHLNHADTERLVDDPRIDFVAFTGSVEGGHAIQHAASQRFLGTGLELGGKDPAYVRDDASLNYTVENLVDGAFFNSGQSCCAVERIYVHQSLYEEFVEQFVALTRQYRLGSPLDLQTNLGPMVRTSAAQSVRNQIQKGLAAGARSLISEAEFPTSRPDSPYLAPHVLIDVSHDMEIMTEETFGPAIGIMSVRDDEEAIQRMNDSSYGLTASVWTNDLDAAMTIGDRVQTGTWFMNRCDYLDPALAWVGVKNSGRGCTLSRVGYEHLTRPKSFHCKFLT